MIPLGVKQGNGRDGAGEARWRRGKIKFKILAAYLKTSTKSWSDKY